MSGQLSGVCASSVMGTILSTSTSFSGGNELVVLNERVGGDLCLGPCGVPFTSFSLLGTLDLTLAGRTTLTQSGTFSATVTAEDYPGTIDGIPAVITLDPSQTSTAQIKITQVESGVNQLPLYRIDSTFDIFSEISLEGEAPIPIGGFPITGVGAPEPATLVLLGLPLAALAGLRRRAG